MATILVVDDHETDRRLLRTLLGYGGHRVVEAADGAEALAAASREYPDLVISDVLMPTMDGFEFVRNLRQDRRVAHVPVMFYSASYRGREASSLAGSCGVSRLLLKPSDPQLILDAVAEILGGSDEVRPVAPDFERQHLQLVKNTLTRTAEEARWLAHRLEKLVDINLHLASERVPAQLLRGFCSAAREFITARQAIVAVRKNGDDRLGYVCVTGLEPAAAAAIEEMVRAAEPLPQVVAEARTIRLHNPGGDPVLAGLPAGHPPVYSLLAAPLQSLKRVYGWICLTDKLGAAEFSDEDARLIGILAAQVGRIYENGSLYAEARTYADKLELEARERARTQARLNLQYSVAQVLAETVSFEAAAPRLLKTICNDAGFAAGALWVVEAAAGVIHCSECWYSGNGPMEAFSAITREYEFRQGEGVPGRVWQSATQAWINDVESVPGFRRLREAKAAGIHGIVAFPVSVGGTVAGVMEFFSLEPRQQDAGQSELFAALSSQIGQFLERRSQQIRIARLARIYAVLSGINALIVRVGTRGELFQGACAVAVEQGEFGIAWIGTYDSATAEVIPVAWAGIGADSIAAGRTTSRDNVPEGQGTLGRAIREKRLIFDNDITRNPGVGSSRRQEALRRGYRSVMAMPLLVDNEVVAIMALFAEERDFFNDEELKLLRELAGDLAFALDHIAKQERLDYLGFFDGLTGLPNRHLFVDRLSQQIDNARRSDANVVLGILNIERFQQVNFSLGRQAGDSLLRSLAERLRKVSLGQASVARIGADTFALALPGRWSPGDSAHLLESSYEDCFGEPFMIGGEELRMSARLGLAVFPGDGEESEALFTSAEAALRKARLQRVRHMFYAPDMNARAAESLRMENRLRRAIKAEELVLYYQPKVGVRSRRLTGAEALMRWQDPERGLVPPGEFIPILEQTGLIFEASRWALSRAVSDALRWESAGHVPPRIAVNVSALDLREKDFVEQVIAAVGGNGHLLELEITESVIMDNIDTSVKALQALRDRGITVAIDDFGTGYSSLAYIAKLPITALKIDRSFITGMMSGEDNLAIVRSIISLAHSLNLKVVAEGVETDEQVARLWQLGCDEMQGYVLSPPVPFHEFGRFLTV